MKSLLSALSIILLITSCLPPSEKPTNEISIDLSDESQQAIINLGDERKTTELISYLQSENATYRYLAAQAMGSVQDSAANKVLIDLLLTDPSAEVRYQAAYAIGQSGDHGIEAQLVSAFAAQDSIDMNSPIRGAILEAVGRIGSDKSLKHLSTVPPFPVTHDQLLLGQMRGLYRFGLRGMTDSVATDRVVSFIMDKNTPSSTRQLAASYLSRMRTIDLSFYIDTLIAELSGESDDFVRMNVISAIGRAARTDDLPVLFKLMEPSNDYRVRVNAVRSLAAFPFSAYRGEVAKYTNDENEAVRLTAASLLRSNATSDQARYLFTLVSQAEDERVKAYLLGGVLRAVPYYLANSRRRAAEMAVNGINSSDSPYTKGLFLEALSYDPINFQEIIDLGINADHVYPRSVSASRLPGLLLSDKYLQVFRTNSARAQIEGAIALAMADVFGSGDEGAIAAAAGALRADELPIAGDSTMILAMKSALASLKLPQETETKYEIEKTLAKWNNQEYKTEQAEYNHPIDWSVLSEINDSSRIYIITPRGQIELELFADQSPGSVANFIRLIRDDYYDGNVIHRVVPNFVVQAGCPRGDGYGSLDYTIRSEVGPVYYDDEGYLGMASAGKDTEGVQWFITHSPTPHLDGRYTIFGKVTNGMKTVHELQVGDRIQDIMILRDATR